MKNSTGESQPVSEIGKKYNFTFDEEKAVKNYKSSYSYKINAKLRELAERIAANAEVVDPDTVLDDFDKALIKQLDSALKKLPVYQGTVYRNLIFDDFGGEEEYQSFLEKHPIGSVVGYPAYTSSSKLQSGHPVKGNYVVNLVIQNKTGRELTGFGNNAEQEILAPRDTVFYVEDIKYESGIQTVYMQEVANERFETDANSGGVTAMQPMQASGTENGGVQSVSGRNPKGLVVQSQGSSEPLSRGSRDSVRSEELRIPASEEPQGPEPGKLTLPSVKGSGNGASVWRHYLDRYELAMAQTPPEDAARWQRYLTQYEEERQLQEAMKTVEILGYVPEEFAELLGEEAGTDYLVMVAKQIKAAGQRSESERLKADVPKKAVDNSAERGIIKEKFVDRINSHYVDNASTAYTPEEIETAMYSSPIGKEMAEYMEQNGYSVSLYYDPTADSAGTYFGKDVYIFPYNNKDAMEISATIIHEMCHIRYGWNTTMEDEVNCRVMELMHTKGYAEEADISDIVAFVMKHYKGAPEGNLYGY